MISIHGKHPCQRVCTNIPANLPAPPKSRGLQICSCTHLLLKGPNLDSLEGVAQQEADLAAGVALFALALIALGSVELRFDLSNAGYLLLLLVEIRAGELVSHGFGPKQNEYKVKIREHACINTPKGLCNSGTQELNDSAAAFWRFCTYLTPPKHKCPFGNSRFHLGQFLLSSAREMR